MPVWDYRCNRCGTTTERSFLSLAEADSISVWCNNPKCHPVVDGGVCRMERQPSAPSFEIRGFSAKNGYAKEGS